jgi:hypothetical protein
VGVIQRHWDCSGNRWRKLPSNVAVSGVSTGILNKVGAVCSSIDVSTSFKPQGICKERMLPRQGYAAFLDRSGL